MLLGGREGGSTRSARCLLLCGLQDEEFRGLGIDHVLRVPHPSIQEISSEYREYADSFGKVSVAPTSQAGT